MLSTVVANPISPDTLLGGSAALVVLAAILFAECGLLLGFFLPGDTLLLAAGISVAIGTISTPLWAFLVVAPLAAIAGNLVGYAIGYKAGPKVFDRPDSKFFSPEYVVRARHFFERYGSWTVVLGRFVPVVRTVTTVMAGVGRMPLGRYTLFTVIGGVIWADGVLLIGHAFGHIAWVRDHKSWIDYAVVAVVIVALVPSLAHYLRARRRSRTN